MGRDLHLTVTSTTPLNVSSFTASDIVMTATATTGTIDPNRINARLVSVTEVPLSGGRLFDVVMRADDSATLKITIAANTVTSTGGLANNAAATIVDNSVTFTNPLTVTPPRFPVIAGEAKGETYALGLKTGAPVPTAPLNFTSTLDAAAVQWGVTASTMAPVIPAGATTSGLITVTAPKANVPANTATTISHTVVSTDPNYNGLVVPSASPHLYSTDPRISITKVAYINVTDPTNVNTIMATGTLAAADSRLTDGQTAYWVYTVTNTSADDWATSLSNITVTDSDTRLGTNGVIATIPTLAQGATVHVYAAGTIISKDTTQQALAAPTATPAP
jgi:hypothetical protein